MRFATKIKEGSYKFAQKHGHALKVAAKVATAGGAIVGGAMFAKYQADELVQRIPGVRDYNVPPGQHAYRNIF